MANRAVKGDYEPRWSHHSAPAVRNADAPGAAHAPVEVEQATADALCRQANAYGPPSIIVSRLQQQLQATAEKNSMQAAAPGAIRWLAG